MKKNNLEDFLKKSDDLEVEIESDGLIEVEINNISPQTPFRKFENIKICAIDPRTKTKIEDLIGKCSDDIAKIKRILNHHY